LLLLLLLLLLLWKSHLHSSTWHSHLQLHSAIHRVVLWLKKILTRSRSAKQ
jgi:hypothetical protein